MNHEKVVFTDRLNEGGNSMLLLGCVLTSVLFLADCVSWTILVLEENRPKRNIFVNELGISSSCILFAI